LVIHGLLVITIGKGTCPKVTNIRKMCNECIMDACTCITRTSICISKFDALSANALSTNALSANALSTNALSEG
jgi:hypothetical protein